MKLLPSAAALLIAAINLNAQRPTETKWVFLDSEVSDPKVKAESPDGSITFLLTSNSIKANLHLNSILPTDATSGRTGDVTIEHGPWKSSQKWQYSGPTLTSEKGTDIFRRIIDNPKERLRFRVFPPGKQSMVADFDCTGIIPWLERIRDRLSELDKKAGQAPVKPLAPR